MIAKTQAQLRSLVQFYTDTESDQNRFTPAQIDIQLDIGLQCYHAALCRSMTWMRVQEHEFTTAANVSDIYAMPLHYKTIAVERSSGSRWYPVRRANIFTSPRVKGATATRNARGETYHEYISNETQYVQLFRATETAGITYRLRYVAPSRTITGEPTPDYDYLFPNGWEEVVALEAAVRLLAADKEDDSQVGKLLERAYKRMEMESSTSDMFQRPTIPGTHELGLDEELVNE